MLLFLLAPLSTGLPDLVHRFMDHLQLLLAHNRVIPLPHEALSEVIKSWGSCLDSSGSAELFE